MKKQVKLGMNFVELRAAIQKQKHTACIEQRCRNNCRRQPTPQQIKKQTKTIGKDSGKIFWGRDTQQEPKWWQLIICQLFFVKNTKQMIPINLLSMSGIPIYMVANLLRQQLECYSQNPSFPQIGAQESNIPSSHNGFQHSGPNLNQEQPQNNQKPDTINLVEQSPQKSEVQEPKPDQIPVQGPQKKDSKGQAKAKRPQNYLTERAYYMKKKLRGKQKSDKRILRKRPNDKTKSTIKVALRSVEQKKKKENAKKPPKGKNIKKVAVQPIDKKNLQKIKHKIIKEYSNNVATLPLKINGLARLNEFCRIKMEALLKRRVRFQ